MKDPQSFCFAQTDGIITEVYYVGFDCESACVPAQVMVWECDSANRYSSMVAVCVFEAVSHSADTPPEPIRRVIS